MPAFGCAKLETIDFVHAKALQQISSPQRKRVSGAQLEPIPTRQPSSEFMADNPPRGYEAFLFGIKPNCLQKCTRDAGSIYGMPLE